MCKTRYRTVLVRYRGAPSLTAVSRRGKPRRTAAARLLSASEAATKLLGSARSSVCRVSARPLEARLLGGGLEYAAAQVARGERRSVGRGEHKRVVCSRFYQ